MIVMVFVERSKVEVAENFCYNQAKMELQKKSYTWICVYV